MKKRIISLLILCVITILGLHAQSYQVTLKVIDETKEITKGSGTGKTIIVELSSNLKSQNPRDPKPTAWWYPMNDNDTEVNSPKGLFTNNTDNFTWEITLNATPGTYTWKPFLKTTWQPLNNYYKYAEEGAEALTFTVGNDGTISGTTELMVKKHPFTLKVVDPTKTVTKGSGTGQNVIVEMSNNLKSQNPRTPSDWWAPMYYDADITPNGIYTENSDNLTWEIELSALPGSYMETFYEGRLEST